MLNKDEFIMPLNDSATMMLFVALLAFAIACSPPKQTLADLEEAILEKVLEADGTFAVAFRDLETDETLRINALEQFHAASTMKTPVMIEVYKQEAEGLFVQGDSILVKNEFYSIIDSSTYQLNQQDDSEQTLYEIIGEKRPINALVYDMIISSSNLATNLIIDIVDARKVTKSMRELGAAQINVLRGVEDIKAYENGLSNSTTAEDLMAIFSALARGEVVSAEASKAMVDILLDQKFDDIIPAQLPVEVKVAHKTGAITGVHHDSGIVFLPDGRKYVLILLSKELPDFDVGTSVLADISGMIYNYMKQHSL